MSGHSLELRDRCSSGGTRRELKRRQVKTGRGAQADGVRHGLEEASLQAEMAKAEVPHAGLAAGSDKFQRILDAAVEVIAERGYFNSPVSAIAARAGVADGTVYLYFKSKADVLKTAIDTSYARFYARVEERFRTMHGPREQLEFIARLQLEMVRENRSLTILMQTEVRQSAKFIAEFSHHHLVRYIRVVREVIRRGQQEGIFRGDVSDGVVAHCMFGAIDELLSSAVFTTREYDPQATAVQVVDVLFNGIAVEGHGA